MKNTFLTISLGMFVFIHTNLVLADPPVPPFYDAVSKMSPTGKLGQVIKKEPVKTAIKGAQAWRIAYISSDVADRKTISTGLVVAPVGQPPNEGRPIIAWGHGTTGTAQNCGPSQLIDPVVPLNEYFLVGGNAWTDYGIPSIEEFIAQGYVVTATDYQGLGGGGRHQYALAISNAKDIFNSARAAKSMRDTGAGKKTIVYGWSQGAGAAAAIASMPDYLSQKGTAADGLELVGAIALATYDNAAMVPVPPTDEASAQKMMNGLLGMFSKTVFDFSHFSMAMWGLQAANPQLKLSDIFTEQGVQVVDKVFGNKCMHPAADTVSYNFGDNYKSLLKANLSNQLAWAQAILKGSNPPIKPIAPVVLYWGTADVTNPPIMGKLYQEQMCKLGGNVERVQLPGAQTHFTTPGTAKPLYEAWIKDRLAGKPASNNCALAATLGS